MVSNVANKSSVCEIDKVLSWLTHSSLINDLCFQDQPISDLPVVNLDMTPIFDTYDDIENVVGGIPILDGQTHYLSPYEDPIWVSFLCHREKKTNPCVRQMHVYFGILQVLQGVY